jgi:hypothetical protein
MHVKLASVATGGGGKLSVRCPHCSQQGTFEPINNVSDAHAGNIRLGLRRCPNPQCFGQLFVIFDQAGNVQRSYPPLRLDFDSTSIPMVIASTFKQAVTCHAEECYVAAAIMIRRCLEELCEDKKCIGKNLKERLESLRSSIVLPNELFLAMDELRLLGNDAAHVEAKTYDTVGREEIEVGLELTKEILKAVYQLDSLVRKLQQLKRG